MHGLNVYKDVARQSEALGASQYQQIQLLLSRLKADIALALTGLESNDLQKITKGFSHAADIVIYLHDCVNLQEGGELAEKLHNIYRHLEQELFYAQLEKK